MENTPRNNEIRDDFAVKHALEVQAAKAIETARHSAGESMERAYRRKAYHAVRGALKIGSTVGKIRAQLQVRRIARDG